MRRRRGIEGQGEVAEEKRRVKMEMSEEENKPIIGQESRRSEGKEGRKEQGGVGGVEEWKRFRKGRDREG